MRSWFAEVQATTKPPVSRLSPFCHCCLDDTDACEKPYRAAARLTWNPRSTVVFASALPVSAGSVRGIGIAMVSPIRRPLLDIGEALMMLVIEDRRLGIGSRSPGPASGGDV